MDECDIEFSSKEVGITLAETGDIIKAITEKKAFIKQATEVVQSQGKKLQDILTRSRSSHPLRGGSSLDLSKFGREGEEEEPGTFAVRRVQSTENILDGFDEPLSSGVRSGAASISPETTYPKHPKQRSWDVLDSTDGILERFKAPIPGSPKILVTPKRTRAATGLKTTLSVPIITVNQNYQVVQSFLVQIDARLNRLILLWEGRRMGLEEAQKAVEFQEAVPGILEWIDTVGAEFLKKYNHYGRSMEEVRGNMIADNLCNILHNQCMSCIMITMVFISNDMCVGQRNAE